MKKKRLLILGASGFIGKNLLAHFQRKPEYEVYGVYHRTAIPQSLKSSSLGGLIKADLTDSADVHRVVQGMDIVIQAAATTSGAKEIVTKPYYHVTHNAVMNSLLLRAAYEYQVKHFLFFSCTVMYPDGLKEPVREEDFNGKIIDKYFGVGWTKVYVEKMCEFYSSIGLTKYTALRHSNIYGPHDKLDLEKSHVFGAAVAKVMAAPEGGKIEVWGDGTEKRDFLYIDDLTSFLDKVLTIQRSKFDLVNVGSGELISVRGLHEKIIEQSGKGLRMEFDPAKPTIPFKIRLNIDRAKKLYQWSPQTSFDEGIRKTLAWYRENYKESPHAEVLSR